MARPLTARTARLRSLLSNRLAGWVAAALVVVLVAVAAVISQGVQTQQTQLHNPTVWAVNGKGPSYAAVNTDVTELETVRSGSAADFKIAGVLQDDSNVVLYSDQQKIAVVDPANPQTFTDPEETESAPFDADQILASGSYVAFLNQSSGALGAESIADLAAGLTPTQINTTTAETTEKFVAGAVDEQGTVTGYTDQGELVTYDVVKGKETARKSVDGPGAVENATLSTFGEHWALLVRGDSTSTLWIDGSQITSDLGIEARVARASSTADVLAVADAEGLHSYHADGSAADLSVEASGTPAQPTWVDGCVYAAWGTGSAATASVCGDQAQTLELPQTAASSSSQLVVRENRGSVVLNDVATGLVWQRENDEWVFVPSSESWSTDEQVLQAADAEQTQDALQNVCPVPATGDNAVFGVRPGQLTNVPVLVGATDANRQDVLAVVADSGTPAWKSGALGNLAIVGDGQALSVDATATSGSGTVSYVLTDGSDCRVSGEATIEVHPESQNEAPVYRAPNDQSLTNLQVSQGGSLRFNGLTGWVDPDGDPVYVLSATASQGVAAATSDGTVAYKADADQEQGRVTITLQVTDGRGGVATRDVVVTVTDSPLLKAGSFSKAVTVGEAVDIDLSDHVSGISGGDVTSSRATLSRASVAEAQQGDVSVVANDTSLTVNVTATSAGMYPITYEVTSGSSTATATLLVTAVEASQPLSTAPITVFLRQDEDVTIDPFSAVVNPSGGVLILGEASAFELTDTQDALSANVVNGSTLRVSGQTHDGAAGRIGTFKYTVSSGDQSVIGQATVFQLDEKSSTQPVAVADQITVRAGAQIDIPVLDNDVAPAGATLMLDPRQTTDDLPGLAFPSGSVLRYLATDEPGSYTLSYRVYSAGHPGEGSLGTVNVQVTSGDGNQSPQPVDLDRRVVSGESTVITVPTAGVDPDGDEVTVVGVTQPAVNGSAQVTSDGRIQVISSTEQGPIEFDYTVADSRGASATAHMRVGVIAGTSVSPVAYNDYVEAAPGQADVAVNPTLNDTRIGDEQLEVTNVVQVVSQLATDSDPVELDVDDNTVTLPTDQLGKTVYKYTVRSSGGATAVGSIVLNVTNDALPTYPVLVDSNVGGSDIDGDRFAVDVLTDKLVWSGADLKTTLRNAPSGINLDGSVVSGSLTDNRQTIAVQVAVADGGDDAPKTWAFVKVPKKSSLRPQLKSLSKTYEVDENSQLDISLNDEVVSLSGRSLQVNSAKSSGTRPDASCSVSGTTVTYQSAKGSSATDGCSVEVQWSGDDATKTTLYLPIKIILDDPPPVLRSQQIAVVDPATTQTVSLQDVTEWSLDKSQLQYSCSSPSGPITVSCQGGQVALTAAPDAQQGQVVSFEATIVSPSFDTKPSATLTVQVGVLPRTTLSPVALSLDLSEGDGASVQGSVEALSGNASTSKYTPLTLTKVDFSGADGVSGTVSGSSISVSIAANTAGGVKSGTYEVQDAQGNVGTGRIEVNYQARPNKPSVTVDTVGDRTVTLSPRQNETLSVPAVTGFNVTWNGGSTTCAVSGTCVISGLTNFESTTFTVAAVNAIGQSRETASATTFAYRGPEEPTVTNPTPTGDGHATVDISGSPSAAEIRVLVDGVVQGETVGNTGETGYAVAVKNTGSTVVAEAVAKTPPPDVRQSPANDPSTSEPRTVFGVGAPTGLTINVEKTGATGTKVKVTATAGVNGGQGTSVKLGIAESEPACTASTEGTSLTVELEGAVGDRKTYYACAQSTWNGNKIEGVASARSAEIMLGADPTGVSMTYTVDRDGRAATLSDPPSGWSTVEVSTPTQSQQNVYFRLEQNGYKTDTVYSADAATGSPKYVFTKNSTRVTDLQCAQVSDAGTTTCDLSSVKSGSVVGAASNDFNVSIENDANGRVSLNGSTVTITGITENAESVSFSIRITFVGNLAGANSFTREITTDAIQKPAA